ncbi:MAG: TolC family protein [Gemmatimonadaceae bacterium]
MKQIEQLEKAGRAARFDVLRSRVDRANLEPALLQARNNQELADIALRQLLSIPTSQPIAFVASLDTAQLHSLVAQADQQNTAAANAGMKFADRALVRSAQANATARHQGVRVSFADYLPTISTTFTTGYTALPASNGFPTLWGKTSNTFCPVGSPSTRVCQNNGWFADRSFAVQFSWNLFDGLRTKGAVDQARAQAQVADLQLAQARRQAETEYAAADAEFTRARAAFDAQRQNADEAQEAYNIAALRFDRGLSTLLEVTDSQNALLTAQVNAARASVDLFVAIADLARTSGRDIPLAPTRPQSR